MDFTKGNLAKAFEEEAAPPPPVLDAESYRALLERLLCEGRGYGKTEPVAAFLLRELRVVTERNGHDEESLVKIPALYVVLDLKEFTNAYARSLVMQDVMVQYARRLVGENDLNAPDFKGSGLWTSKIKSFEEDYRPRPGEKNIYEPNPDAYRVCLKVDEPATIPVPWGTWPVGAGGALAVREKDVPALAEALLSIREGRATVEQALFTKDDRGQTVSRFDVYGMAPGFLDDNYKPVVLKENTLQAMAQFSGENGRSSPPIAPKI